MNRDEITEKIKEEETFLLKLFQLEKVVKKYKNQLIVLLILIVGGFVGFQVNSYLEEQKLIETNQAYNKLLRNSSDLTALHTLKENKPLFKLYLLQTSNGNIKKLKQVSQGVGVVANIAKYELAVLKGDKKEIENYSLTLDAIYKDLALLNLERFYLQNGNHKKAVEIEKQIVDEDIKRISKVLIHYGIVK